MRNFVDTIKKGDDEYDIRDTRVPDSAVADAGKVVKVGADGGYELGEAGESGGDYIKIPSSIGWNSTLQDIINLGLGIELPASSSTNSYDVEFEGNWYAGNSRGKGKAKLDIRNYGSVNIEIIYPITGSTFETKIYQNVYTGTGVDSLLSNYVESKQVLCTGVPNLPSDASSKTYVLKAVNGTIQWVEETA